MGRMKIIVQPIVRYTETPAFVLQAPTILKFSRVVLELACDFQLGELSSLFMMMEIYCLLSATLSTDTCHMRSYSYLRCKTTIS